MIKFSFWLFLFSGLTLIFGILYFNNLHEEEILVERIKQTSDREIEREKLSENDEERKYTETKKVKKVSLSRWNSKTCSKYTLNRFSSWLRHICAFFLI